MTQPRDSFAQGESLLLQTQGCDFLASLLTRTSQTEWATKLEFHEVHKRTREVIAHSPRVGKASARTHARKNSTRLAACFHFASKAFPTRTKSDARRQTTQRVEPRAIRQALPSARGGGSARCARCLVGEGGKPPRLEHPSLDPAPFSVPQKNPRLDPHSAETR